MSLCGVQFLETRIGIAVADAMGLDRSRAVTDRGFAEPDARALGRSSDRAGVAALGVRLFDARFQRSVKLRGAGAIDRGERGGQIVVARVASRVDLDGVAARPHLKCR